MDRPKPRRKFVLGFVLLASGVLLLFHRQWMPAPESLPAATGRPDTQRVHPQPENIERAIGEVTTASLPPQLAAPAVEAATGLHGQVIDAVTRQPLKEFDVELTRLSRDAQTEHQPITRSFKSASGRFAWADVPQGTWRAAVSAAGYQRFNVDEFRISADTQTIELIMPLLRGFSVRGRVVERSTGAAIVGATIFFWQEGVADGFGRSKAVAKSKEDGSFMLDGVPAGDIVLTVGARDHTYRDLKIVVNEETPPQEIALYAGGTIAGTVMTAAGVPVAGTVYLQGPGPGYVARTNEAGQFSYAHMPAGEYRLSANTRAGGGRQEFTLGEDESNEGVILVVGAGRSVRGTIRGLQPEQMQTTRLLLRAESGNVVLSTNPDERGAYALKGVPAGRAVLEVHGAAVRFNKTLDVPADKDVTLDIDFPAGARLSGRITQGGKPAVDHEVRMVPVDDESHARYHARTSPEGRYEIQGLPPGAYRLQADDDVSRSIAMDGDQVLNIDIPSVQLSARVVEEGGAVPIVGADVYVRGTTVETSRVRGDKQTDDFGQFAFTGIEPGEIVLIVYKPGYEMHREKIAYSSPINNRTITLRKSLGVEARVQPGSRRFPRGFTITQSFSGSDSIVDLWMPLDRDGVAHVPRALAGTTLQIGRFSGKPIVIEEWDGQPFELP